MTSTDSWFERRSISAALARRLIAAAIERAETMAPRFVVAVVDETGQLKALERMDGASVPSIQVAQDKAYTAAGFGFPTGAWWKVIGEDPALSSGAPAGIDRLVIFAGGRPIVVDGVLVGAIGVSGGTPDDDETVARAALNVLVEDAGGA